MKKTKFKRVYTIAQAKEDPRVDDMFAEFGHIDSNKYDWWIYLKDGYVCETSECLTIHEQTVKQCLDILNNYVITKDEWEEKYKCKFS